jgi:RimJ/RimL family protein N-acetyltransferase/catechol 2,3-dioxygenase-like lactoylglutathione lyase family enzyme
VASLSFPTLNDGVVALRPWRRDDAGDLVAALDDPEVSLWIPVIPYPYRLEDAEVFFDLVGREADAGRMVAGAIVDHADGRLFGGIGMSSISRGNASAEVGYWVAAAERGRGVATRAAKLLVDWGFAELGLDRIGLLADTDNVASRRVAKKLRFVEEGVLRSYMMTRRGRRDSVMYGRLATDPEREEPSPALPARVSLVTLGVRDLERMRSFFERVGWPLWTTAEDGFTGYSTGGAMLALYPIGSLAELSGAGRTDKGEWSGVTLAVNVEERALVDGALEAARAAGADIVVEPVDAEWGGRSGCFADPEGNRFEVAWMPGSSFDARGALIVPRAEED